VPSEEGALEREAAVVPVPHDFDDTTLARLVSVVGGR
jgi:hypothetical protein